MTEFKDLKKGDTFEATFEAAADAFSTGKENYVVSVSRGTIGGNIYIDDRSIKDLKILPRPISVGDCVSYGSCNGSIATVLHIHEDMAFLMVDRDRENKVYFAQLLKSLTRTWK